MCGYEEVHHLIEDYQSRLLYYADLLLNNCEEAGKAVRLVFIRWIRARRKEPSARVNKPFVRLLADLRGICRDAAGTRRERPSRIFSPDHGFTSGDDSVRAIRERVSALSPREQELLVLHYAFALRYEDISEITGLPVSQVADSLHHAAASLASSSDPEKQGGNS